MLTENRSVADGREVGERADREKEDGRHRKRLAAVLSAKKKDEAVGSLSLFSGER